jgi:hypothetical protein
VQFLPRLSAIDRFQKPLKISDQNLLGVLSEK